MNAGDQLWIISGHDHGGYAAPNNGNSHDLPTCGQTSTSAFYSGYAHHRHGQAPPSNGYGYASTSYGGYASLSYGYDPPNKFFPPLVKN